METSVHARRGFSLIELIIVIGILAIMVGFLLVALQKGRASASLIQNKNNHRQIILAVHQLASDHDGNIENLARSSMAGVKTARRDSSLFTRLIPYVHGDVQQPKDLSSTAWVNFLSPEVKVYRNPADPSWDYDPGERTVAGKCSYALNMFAVDGSLRLASSIQDGTSQTFALADKYAVKGSQDYSVAQTVNLYTGIFDPMNGEVYGWRRATFADRGWEDVLPVTDGPTATTKPSIPGMTFQMQPRPELVDPRITQTPHQAGLTVALFDGSVTSVKPSVDEGLFWSRVTPSGGEAVRIVD